jgi:vesicle-fusing ATPase
MPEDCMHMTTMEVTHSRTYEEIQAIVSKASNAFPGIANYTANHRARLVKPYLGFDSTAIALSYLPAAGEPSNDKKAKEHPYTYHHLRRDLFNKCTEAGIEVQSRYVALSAHLTMARFIDQKDFVLEGTNKLDLEKVKRFIAVIEDINEWLERNYWPNIDGDVSAGTEWVAGEGTVVVREGQLWYGGGHTLYEGEGF